MTTDKLESLVGLRMPNAKSIDELCDRVGGSHDQHELTTYVIISDLGTEIAVDRNLGIVLSVKIFADAENMQPYPHPLPRGLRWGMKRDDVRAILGPPKLSSDGKTVLSITLPPNDNYDWNGIEMCIVYGGEDAGVSQLGFQIRDITGWRKQQEDALKNKSDTSKRN